MIGRVVRGLARRAGVRFFRLFARPLDSLDPPTLSGLRFGLLEEHELQPWSADPELALRPEGIAAGYARGDFCAGAFHGDTLVGYCCFAFAPLPHLDGVWADFPGDVAWTYKSFVRPSHRGRGIAPALYRFADPACRERGRRRSLICVESHNQASVQAALGASYVAAGDAGYWVSRLHFVAWGEGVRFFRPEGR